MTTEPSDTSGDDMLRTLQEQLAFLEREQEHHRAQIKDLWDELTNARREIARLRETLDEGKNIE